jgi:hypothetical protein
VPGGDEVAGRDGDDMVGSWPHDTRCRAATRRAVAWTAREDSKAARIVAELPYNPEVMKCPAQ